MYTTRTWVGIMSILPICWCILPLCFDNKVFYYCSISFQLSIYPHSFSINDCIKKCHVRSIRATYTHIQNLYSASLYYTVVQNFMHFDWAKLQLFGNKLAKSGKNRLISVVLKRQKKIYFFKIFLGSFSDHIFRTQKMCLWSRQTLQKQQFL